MTILILFLLLIPTPVTKPVQLGNAGEPCKPFSASGIVRRRLVHGSPRSRNVALFDLMPSFEPNIAFEPPSPRFFTALRPGNKVTVRGRHCGFDYFADSVKRVR
jgi:hypothetical protein